MTRVGCIFKRASRRARDPRNIKATGEKIYIKSHMDAHTSGSGPAGPALIIAGSGPPGPEEAAGIDEAEAGTCAEGAASPDASSSAPGTCCCG